MIALRLYGLILAGSGAVLAAYLLLRRKRKSADDLERERREWLDRVGRITDGTVSYEASQDVTYLRPRINLHSCRLGLPTSVRYDPQNPGNSMVVSERWLGLRQ
jgi:hypothetical protein